MNVLYEGLSERKLFPPAVADNTILRPSLLKSIDKTLDTRLTLVSASTGFGKSTLVSQWLQTVEQVSFGWYALDEDDNDPVRFFRYLQATIQIAFGLQTDPATIVYAVTTDVLSDVLINLLNQVVLDHDLSYVIVLDDFHLIHNHIIEMLVMTLLEHMPDACHLLLISRVDPPIPLGRLRAQGQLTEIRQHDLRFSSEDATQFFNTRLEQPLSFQQVHHLHQRTEGWIAGLQLAALAIANTGENRQAFIKDFKGNHRYIVDYLYDEVWSHLAAEVQHFLLETCILDRFNAKLCNAIRQKADSATYLTYLEQNNLFVIPLDEQREWYRYHHLFVDLLRQRLPEDMSEYHMRVSEWYLQDDPDLENIYSAIKHGFAAQAPARVAAILEAYGDALWESGQHDHIRQWLDKLSDRSLKKYPKVNILRAWLDITNGNYSRAHHWLVSIDESSISPVLLGQFLAVKAFLATFEGRPSDTIQYASQALDLLDGTNSTWRSTAAIALGDAHIILRTANKAIPAYQQAIQISQQSNNPYLTLNAVFKLAGAYRQRGLLQKAHDICSSYIDYADEVGLAHTTLAGCLLGMRGDIQCDWFGLAAALNDTQKALDASANSYHIGFLGWIYLFRLRVLLSARQLDEFDTTLSLFGELTQASGLPPWLKSPFSALQGLRWLVANDIAKARGWALEHNLNTETPVDLARIFEFTTFARLLYEDSELKTSLAVTDRLMTILSESSHLSPLIVTHILRSLIYQQMEQSESATQELIIALDLAEPGNLVLLFIEGGQLLYDLLNRQPNTPFVSKIKSAFAAHHVSPHAESSLTESLSDRELDVLSLIANGLSNQAIADSLFISLNTVLYHTKNIYSKLAVRRRTQAVQRARELNLL